MLIAKLDKNHVFLNFINTFSLLNKRKKLTKDNYIKIVFFGIGKISQVSNLPFCFV